MGKDVNGDNDNKESYPKPPPQKPMPSRDPEPLRNPPPSK